MANILVPDITDVLFQENADAKQGYRHSETVNAETGEWLLIPAGIGDILVSVEPASGTARVEYTQASVSEVEANTATGKPWSEADVSGYTASIMSNTVTAIRCVATAGCDFVVTA